MFNPNELRIIRRGEKGEINPSFEEERPEELSAADEEGEKDEMEEKIKKEQQEARENFQDLIAMVSKRYESLPENMREEFLIHNQEGLDNVIALGVRKNFSPEEMKKSEVSAILHDIAKADAVPEKFKDVPNYALANHGQKAAEESEEILTDGYLSEHGFSGDLEDARKTISAAIREHMGPHPGFMDGILNGVNTKLREMGEKEIEHPKAQGKISETLLAADMASLAGEKGRQKVLSIRENVAFFKNIDSQTLAEYKKYGIDLKQGEAAILSGFDSADQARDMIQDEKDKEWINRMIEKSKEGEYSFAGEKIDAKEALAKRAKFEEAKKLDEVRKKLKLAA